MGWKQSDSEKLIDLFRTGQADPNKGDYQSIEKVYFEHKWIRDIYPGQKKKNFYQTFRRWRNEYLLESKVKGAREPPPQEDITEQEGRVNKELKEEQEEIEEEEEEEDDEIVWGMCVC